MAVKLFIRRPGIEGFLPSFNFGFRLKKSSKGWLPCELEALSLSKGIETLAPYLKLTGNPVVALVDSKPIYQAKMRLDQGKFSTNRRLQDLLTNLSIHRVQLQHISAKLPSSLLKMIDFNSRNPVECKVESYTICQELQNPDVTYFGKTFSKDVDSKLISRSSWIDVQKSCSDLRKVHTLLLSGKEVAKKEKNREDLKKYL